MAAGQDERLKLKKLIDKIEVAMLTTIADDGTLHSRPMGTIEAEFDGTIWFFARGSSGKTIDIKHDQHVGLSYALPSRQDYVSVSGRARLIHDHAKIDELWTESLTTWFPKGKTDPDIVLIGVSVDSAEYWDAPSATMINLFGWAKAKLTGEPPHPGGHANIENRR